MIRPQPAAASAAIWLIAAAAIMGGCARADPQAAPDRAGSEAIADASGPPPSPPVLASRVDAYVAPYVTMWDFSGTVLISREGRVLISRGYGFADFERRLVPDGRTSYGIGSITKTMTAAAVLLLAGQGRLALDDPLTRFLPGFAHGDSITITHLLEHSSGLRDYYSWPAYASGRAEPISRDEFLSRLQAEPLDFPPGTRSAYSNSGYAVLAAIVERVSGLSYGEFLERNLFRPLRMDASGDLRDGAVVPGLATGYDPGFPPARVQPAAQVSRSWLEGSGSVYAGAEDLLRWAEAARRGTLVDLDALPYPYGWGKRTRFGREMVEQSGRIPIGYASYLGLYPREDLVVIVLSNIQAEVTERMGVDLAAIALGQPYEVPPLRPMAADSRAADATAFDGYAGRYEIAPGFVLSVRADAEGILLAGPDGAFLPVDFEGADRFFFRPLYVPVTFVRDGTGRIVALDWNGQAEAKRIDAGG